MINWFYKFRLEIAAKEYKKMIKIGLNVVDVQNQSQDSIDKQLNSNYLTRFLNDRVISPSFIFN
jgi:hypothetical protein